MITVCIVPLFLSILVGLVLSLLCWRFLRTRNRRDPVDLMATTDQVLMGLALLAAFAFGAFLTYVFFAWVSH